VGDPPGRGLAATDSNHAEARHAELQQAADDVLAQITDPIGAIALADMAMSLRDPIRKRQMLTTLGRRLEGPWRAVVSDSKVLAAIAAALNDPETRLAGIPLAAGTGDPRWVGTLMNFVLDEKADAEVRVAAVEVWVGSSHP